MYVRHINVQRQSGPSDCSIFAIVFATALCMGIDPYTHCIDPKKSRTHLLKCFEQKHISAFPLTERPQRITAKRVATIKTVKLFCVCHMPYKKMMSPQWHSALNARNGFTNNVLRYLASFLKTKLRILSVNYACKNLLCIVNNNYLPLHLSSIPRHSNNYHHFTS